MNTNILEFTSLQNKIFRLLCIKAKEKLNQSEIASNLKVTSSGVSKALVGLEKEKFVIIDKNPVMNLNLISLNRNQDTLRFKQLENLKQIYELNLITFLEEKYPGATLILFGSYANGEDTVKSDIDIAIIGCKQKSSDLSFFEKKLERQININFYDSMKAIHKDLRENICNGIVLSGAIEL